MEGLDGWYQPTMGSADYFNRCCKRACGVPRNVLGMREARTGNGYTGIICYLKEKGKKDYREYLETQFTERLTKDHVYCVQVHVCLAGSSLYATNNLDIFFSRFLVKSDNDKCLEQVPQLSYQDSLMSDESRWKELSWTFKAEGGERFMVIGNFKNDKNTEYKRLPKEEITNQPFDPFKVQYPEAYYYLDDVCVVDITESGKCEWDFNVTKPVADKTVQPPPAEPASGYDITQKLVLKNIYFNTDKAILLPSSFRELDKLFDFLSAHRNLRIQITGHTDNQGTSEHNLVLSEARAKAVKEYLISKGIDEGRIESAGVGNTQPIATNETEEGRQLNRRVEVVFVK
jgi:OOP family OmpA-OmpF porin